MTAAAPLRGLRHNRDFQLLWSGQVVSTFGSRISSIALPLLVLDLTGSAADAGVVRFAGYLPLLLFLIPAGVFLDRTDRKRVMLATEVVRALALGSIAAAIAFGAVSFAQILAVSVIGGTGLAFFEIAQRASLRQLVPAEQRSAALVQNEVRENAALIGGLTLGGVLYGMGRLVPFAADAASFVVSLLTVAFIRTPLQETRERVGARLWVETGEGMAFLWRQPFLRTTALLVTGSNLVVNALYLVVIVIARRQGATPGEIGVMVAFIGVGGLLGSAAASRLRGLLSVRRVVVTTMAAEAVLVPLLLVAPGPLAVGAIYGAMFFLHPTWSSTIGPYFIALVPDRLQARFQSATLVLSLGAVPLGSLLAGLSLDAFGAVFTISWLAVVMFVVVVVAAVSRSVRQPPPLAADSAAS